MTDTLRGLRDRAILETLYSTGLRRQELCQLHLRHLDLAHRLVRVEHGKGGKDRIVPIGDRAIAWLERYLREARTRFKPAPDEPAVFLNAFGRRVTGQGLGGYLRQIIRASGLAKPGGCHLLRHAFATA